ncbi:Hint domain-containing protein [Myxococcus stipitatus]|uniref:Hint domain-containing protein n=1 Tax=Myxococcus stipitatus TaxID=83455 RepID=UPI0030D4CC6D
MSAFWSQKARLLPLAGVVLMSAGWSNTLNAPAEDRDRAQRLVERFDRETENSDALHINLNLADDGDWNFLVGRLTSAGKDEKNAPELFNRLGFMRQRALGRAGQSATPADEPAWCNHFLKYKNPPLPSNGYTTYFPVVEVACKDGADYVYADLFNYDEDENGANSVLVSSASGEEYGNGRAFDDVEAVATIATGKGRVLRMESLVMALGPNLDQTTYILLRSAVTNQLPSMTFTHPRKVLLNSQHAEIYACQLRGGTDCDYAVAGYQNGVLRPFVSPATSTGVAASYPAQAGTLNPADYWAFGAPYNYQNLYVPIRGTLNAGAANNFQCTVSKIEKARIQLVLNDSGRTCLNSAEFITKMPLGGNQSPVNVLTNMNYLFNTPGPGQSPSSCDASTVVNEMTRFMITIVGKVRCNTPVMPEKPFVVVYPMGGSGSASNIFFHNSCMAEGTRVTMADGRVVPVEQVKLGDKVRANDKGDLLSVTDIARGNEVKPLLRLRDSRGHDATLTEMHPVVMATGEVVTAKSLKVKDQVRTAQGVSTLTSITPVSTENARVYNLRLGTDQELLAVNKNGRTLFAGGFLVGDLSMQDALTRPAREQVSVLEQLPKAWHRDFLNGMKPAVQR